MAGVFPLKPGSWVDWEGLDRGVPPTRPGFEIWFCHLEQVSLSGHISLSLKQDDVGISSHFWENYMRKVPSAEGHVAHAHCRGTSLASRTDVSTLFSDLRWVCPCFTKTPHSLLAFRVGRTDGSPPPHTVGAANDWVLMMLAISAPGLLTRGMQGNRAHTQQQAEGGLCAAENLGKVAVSQVCPKRERMASTDSGGLSAAPSPVAQLRLITKGALRVGVTTKFCEGLDPCWCEEAPEEPRCGYSSPCSLKPVVVR